jgi:hypothetical protein
LVAALSMSFAISSLRSWPYIALVLAVAVSADSVSGQESGAATDQHGDVGHAFPNEAPIFMGNTAKGGENSFTAGLEYERRLGGRFGAGLFLDWAANHHEREFIVGATAVYRPGLGNLKLLAGPSLELEEHEPSKSTVEENGSGQSRVSGFFSCDWERIMGSSSANSSWCLRSTGMPPKRTTHSSLGWGRVSRFERWSDHRLPAFSFERGESSGGGIGDRC